MDAILSNLLNRILENIGQGKYSYITNHALQEKITEAIFHLRQAIKLDSKSLEWAKTEINFDRIRNNEEFVKVINGY